MKSLVRQLTTRFSTTMLLALSVIGGGVYVGVDRLLHEQLDLSLRVAADLVAETMAAGALPRFRPPQLDVPGFIEHTNHFIIVRSTGGEVLASYLPADFDPEFHEETAHQASNGHELYRDERWSDQDVRVLYHRARWAGGDVGVVQVGAALQPVRRTERGLLAVLAITIAMGTLATAFGSGWLARSATVPVKEISQAARQIPIRSRAQITVHADTTEFHDLVETLNRLLSRLQNAMATQRRIIADAGHDFRTPLTSMRGEIEVALRGERPPQQYRRALQSCLEDVDRLTRMAESMLLLSRLETREREVVWEDVDLRSLAEEALQSIRDRSEGREFRFSEGIAADVPASADSALLGILLRELLENAAIHTPSNSITQVTVRRTGNDAEILVQDSGPLNPDQVPPISEPFYRGDAARSRGAGAGIGLSIAAAIMEGHGGTLKAYPSPLGGLAVSARWPQPAGGSEGRGPNTETA